MESSAPSPETNQPQAEFLTPVEADETALAVAGLAQQIEAQAPAESLSQPATLEAKLDRRAYAERYSREEFLLHHDQSNAEADKLALEMAGGFGSSDRVHTNFEIAGVLGTSASSISRRMRTIFASQQSAARPQLSEAERTRREECLAHHAQIDNQADQLVLEMAGGFGRYDRIHSYTEIAKVLDRRPETISRRLRTILATGHSINRRASLYAERYSREEFLAHHAQIDDQADKLALEMAGGFGRYDRAHTTQEIAEVVETRSSSISFRLKAIFETGQSAARPQPSHAERRSREELLARHAQIDDQADKQALEMAGGFGRYDRVHSYAEISEVLGTPARTVAFRVKTILRTDRSVSRMSQRYNQRSRQELFELRRQLTDANDRAALAMLSGLGGYIRRYTQAETAEALGATSQQINRRLKLAFATGQSAGRIRATSEELDQRSVAYDLINKTDQASLVTDYQLQPNNIERLGQLLPQLDRLKYEIVASLYGLAGRQSIAHLDRQVQLEHIETRLLSLKLPTVNGLVDDVRRQVIKHINSWD